MFKTVEEIKEFVTWARSQKIKSVKVGDLEIEMSELAYVEPMNAEEIISRLDNKTYADDADSNAKKEEEELLLWSAN